MFYCLLEEFNWHHITDQSQLQSGATKIAVLVMVTSDGVTVTFSLYKLVHSCQVLWCTQTTGTSQ